MKKILIISNLYPSKKNPFYGSFVKNFVDDLITYNGQEKYILLCIKRKGATMYL